MKLKNLRVLAANRYVQCMAVTTISILIWFSDYLLHGYMFLSEAGQLLWADWIMARTQISTYGHIGWNPNVLFGVNFLGREAFLNPLNTGSLLGFMFPDAKSAFMILTMLFLGAMGLSMYIFLTSLSIDHFFALIGVSMYTLAPKWVDDAYHGPRFLIGYALLPLLLLLFHRMHKNGFRQFHNFALVAVMVSLMYLTFGAVMLFGLACLFVPYFVYLLWLYWASDGEKSTNLIARVGFYSVLTVLLFIGLSSYILFPFFEGFSHSERSLYSPPTGFPWEMYIGLVFPWINRIYAPGVYDLAYPVALPILYPNLYLYFGILTVPVTLYAITHRIWTKITAFFLFFPVAWLLLWSSSVIKLFPLLPWLDSFTKSGTLESHSHVTIIFSLAVTVSSVLNEIAKSPESPIFESKHWPNRYLGYLNLAIIFCNAFAALVFSAAAIVVNSDLSRHYWGLISNGYALLLRYYFHDAVVIFLGMFLIRGLTVWLYHKQYFSKRWGVLTLLILILADFQLCFRIWYPFTDLDARYSTDLPENQFVIDQTDSLDRIGAYQFSLGEHTDQAKLLFSQKATYDHDKLIEAVDAIYYKGFIKPLFEPSLTYFPVIVDRSLYSFHESAMPKYFWDFDAAMNMGNPRYRRQSWTGVWDPHSKLLDVAGIKYLFWYEPIEDSRLVEVAKFHNSSYVYLNVKAVPRAYLVQKVEYYSDRTLLLDRLSDPTFEPLQTVTTEDAELYKLLHRATISDIHATRSHQNNSVNIMAYTPDFIQLSTHTDSEEVLVLNDMYYPGWTAKINGFPTEIFRVNCVFRAVVLPAGQNTVNFYYQNSAFQVGALTSGLCWAFMLISLVGHLVNRRTKLPTSHSVIEPLRLLLAQLIEKIEEWNTTRCATWQKFIT